MNLFSIDDNLLDISRNSEFIFEFDKDDELIKKILEWKENSEYKIYADNIYNLLKEKEDEKELDATTNIQDLFDINVNFSIKKPFIDFYYKIFDWQ